MHFFVHWSWSLACCALAAGYNSDPTVKDARALQGEWNFVAIEQGGVATALPAAVRGQKWVIKGDDIKAVAPFVAGDHNMAFRLDSTKTPKEMDLMPQYDPYKGQQTPAIYELKAGRLRVCSADPGGKLRPTNFASGAMVFEKVDRQAEPERKEQP
jgi:uncharacterized protein (TIGR03067 family)